MHLCPIVKVCVLPSLAKLSWRMSECLMEVRGQVVWCVTDDILIHYVLILNRRTSWRNVVRTDLAPLVWVVCRPPPTSQMLRTSKGRMVRSRRRRPSWPVGAHELHDSPLLLCLNSVSLVSHQLNQHLDFRVTAQPKAPLCCTQGQQSSLLTRPVQEYW